MGGRDEASPRVGVGWAAVAAKGRRLVAVVGASVTGAVSAPLRDEVRPTAPRGTFVLERHLPCAGGVAAAVVLVLVGGVAGAVEAAAAGARAWAAYAAVPAAGGPADAREAGPGGRADPVAAVGRGDVAAWAGAVAAGDAPRRPRLAPHHPPLRAFRYGPLYFSVLPSVVLSRANSVDLGRWFRVFFRAVVGCTTALVIATTDRSHLPRVLVVVAAGLGPLLA